jgi:hypothetical protein
MGADILDGAGGGDLLLETPGEGAVSVSSANVTSSSSIRS